MGILTTALTGFFVATSVAAVPGGMLASTSPLAGGSIATQEATLSPDEIPIRSGSLSVSMTGYNAVPEQTDSDPETTASGAVSNPHIVAARSIDLADELPYGTVIQIVPRGSGSGCGIAQVAEDIGLRVIADSMHSRKRNQIDIMFDTDSKVSSGNPAITLGICSDVTIKVVGHVDVAHMPTSQRELARAIGTAVFAFGGK